MTRAIPPHTRVRATVDGWADRLLSLSHALHAEPETAFEEHASVARLGALLREAGFEVAEGVHGLPTALTATYGSGGPTIGVCAEYDALPGLGHACGHNVICAASAGAAVALRPLADELGFRVKVIGSPAEEEGGGKVLLLERGAFDDVTVAMMAHPERHDHCRAENSSPAVSRFRITFEGRASHAAAAPERALNAADAAVVAQVAVGLLRQQVAGDCQIAGIVTDGGTVSNIIPESSTLHYEVRTPSAEQLDGLKERVLNCFRGAAIATGTTMSVHSTQPDYLDLRHDPWLMHAYGRHITALGRTPRVPSDGTAPPGGSTDMGNVTHVLPAIHPSIGILGAEGTPHTRQFAAEAISPAADRAVLDAAKALALTAVDLVLDEEQCATVLAAHRERLART
ncbi:amidohydrolase [Streptomyces sp. NBC_00101]|uniref:amidohydrolase n=1 Tax=Streptomyces sp. NBC_00101 TaxID=2975651 RepID=UPI003255FFF2